MCPPVASLAAPALARVRPQMDPLAAAAAVSRLLACPCPLSGHFPRGYRGAAENVRKCRALICLDTTRFLAGVYFASFSYGMFGHQTWPFVNSLKRDEDPVIAINAVCAGAPAARAYLRFLFADGGPAPALMASHAQKLFKLVNVPWHRDGFYSLAGCCLVLHGPRLHLRASPLISAEIVGMLGSAVNHQCFHSPALPSSGSLKT
jgi:hypothetical protein